MTRSGADAQGGRNWNVTYLTAVGDVPQLTVTNELPSIGVFLCFVIESCTMVSVGVSFLRTIRTLTYQHPNSKQPKAPPSSPIPSSMGTQSEAHLRSLSWGRQPVRCALMPARPRCERHSSRMCQPSSLRTYPVPIQTQCTRQPTEGTMPRPRRREHRESPGRTTLACVSTAPAPMGLDPPGGSPGQSRLRQRQETWRRSVRLPTTWGIRAQSQPCRCRARSPGRARRS